MGIGDWLHADPQAASAEVTRAVHEERGNVEAVARRFGVQRAAMVRELRRWGLWGEIERARVERRTRFRIRAA